MNSDYFIDDEMPGGRDRWLLSYADLLTLLLAFFVVMYSVSALDDAKLAELSSSLASSFNQETPVSDVTFSDVVDALDLQQKQVETNQGETIISLPGSVLFDSGSAELKSSARDELNKLLPILQSTSGTIVVEGHTDNVPSVGRYPSNWELSASRASAAVRFFTAAGIDKQRLSAVGLADTVPVANNNTGEQRSLNRRVVFKVTGVDWQDIQLSVGEERQVIKTPEDSRPLSEPIEEPLNELLKESQESQSDQTQFEDIDPELLRQVLEEMEAGGN